MLPYKVMLLRKKTTKSKVEEKSDADLDKEELDRVRQRFNAKKMTMQDKNKPTKLDMDDDEEEEQTPAKPTESVKEEIERLKRELKRSKKSTTTNESTRDIDNGESDPAPPMAPVGADTSVLMDELMSGTRRSNKKQHSSHSNSRENQTLSLLAKFQAKLHAVKDDPTPESVDETKNEQAANEAPDEFLKHRFVSTELLDNVQDIYTNAELLTVYDPRNPMAKRRRNESSQLLHQKKQRGRT